VTPYQTSITHLTPLPIEDIEIRLEKRILARHKLSHTSQDNIQRAVRDSLISRDLILHTDDNKVIGYIDELANEFPVADEAVFAEVYDRVEDVFACLEKTHEEGTGGKSGVDLSEVDAFVGIGNWPLNLIVKGTAVLFLVRQEKEVKVDGHILAVWHG